VWPFNVFSSTPVEASHTRTDLSGEPETIRVPSLENATPNTLDLVCMFISGTVVLLHVYVTEGARENCFFHIRDITEFRDHVINEDMYI
jgi:hypothetical protein